MSTPTVVFSGFRTRPKEELVELQIYTGDDSFDAYYLGDPVAWRVNPDYPGQGTLLDGVYDATPVGGPTKAPLYYVIIRGGRIWAIVSSTVPVSHEFLKQKHNIKPPSKRLWGGRAWDRYHKRRRQRNREARRLHRAVRMMTPDERQVYLARTILAYVRERMKETSFARTILESKEVA